MTTPVGDPGVQPVDALDLAHLEGGALLPAGTSLPDGEPAELADGRIYRHPALAGRVVVRLSARPLAAADDTEMEVLGFGPPEIAPSVGVTRPRALGFPGWALVNDPAHARHALSVVKDFKVQAKLARSKPGHAREGFDAIAEALARSVPHFLPSFHEEAGRAFLDAGNRTYAASAFARAREAERVHALDVDPALRDRAFLEFALAGAVSGKALSEFAQALAEATDPRGAYARFRDLCVRRTLGGMPPWAAMGRDLKRLAKLAGADLEAEDQRLLGEVLGSPALLHAAAEFWTTYGPALERMAKGSAAVRGALLRFLPEPPGNREAFVTAWLELLERCGALAGVIEPRASVPAEARPDDGAAGWLSRLLSHTRGYSTEAPDAVFALVRRMAGRLREEGEPVRWASRWGGVDLDLLDLLLELEVPVADPDGRVWMRLGDWIKGRKGSQERPRDPVHVVRDARFRPHVQDAVGGAMGHAGFDGQARRMRGLAEARRGWVMGRLQLLGSGTLPAAAAALDQLAAALTPASFSDLPEAWRALGEVDLASVLARTLRGGIVDELGWPALEAAAASLAGGSGAAISLHGTFPYAILQAGLRALVVGPAGEVLEHELRLPKGSRLHGLGYAQRQLLVTFARPEGGLGAYWSGRPDESFELPYAYSWGMETRCEIELEDGAMVRGGRALHAGDHAVAERAFVAGDGVTTWTLRDGVFRELDPRSGALGRKSLPRFFEEFAKEGTTLELAMCQLLPLPGALRDRTPLGSRDGLAGLRVRRLAGGALELESVDGARAEIAAARGGCVSGLLRLPGGEGPLLLAASHSDVQLLDASGQPLAVLQLGTLDPLARGTPVVLPPPFWHLLTVRDEGGSRALRKVGVEEARRLLDAASQDLAAGAGAQPHAGAALASALAAVLPSVCHEGLRAGVLGIARETAALGRRLEAQRAAWDPARAPEEAPASLDAAAVASALAPLVERVGYSDEGDLAAELGAVSGFMRAEGGGGERPLWKRALGAVGLAAPEGEQIVDVAPGGGFRWDQLVGATGAVAFVAASPLLGAAARKALGELLGAWAATPMVGGSGRMRRCRIRFPSDSPYKPAREGGAGRLVGRGGHRWFVRPNRPWGGDRDKHDVLELAADGRFALPPGTTLEEEEAIDDQPWTPARLRRFLAALERSGAPPLSGEAISELARRTGLTRPEAALLWTGLPGLEGWEHDFLGRERREALGLKAAEAKVARDALQKVPREVRREVLAAAMSGDPEGPWRPLGGGTDDEGSPVALAAAAWVRLVGRRTPIAPEVLVRCAKELPRALEPAAFLSGLTACARHPAWNRDGEWELAEAGARRVGPADDEGEVFSDDILLATARYFAFLFEALPVGDPLRATLPDAIRLSRQRLGHRGLIVGLYSQYSLDKPGERDALLDAIGSEPYPAGGDRAGGRDGGMLLVRAGRWSMAVGLRPARMTDASDGARRLVERQPGYAAARLLLGEDFGRMAARVATSPVPPGGWEANPLASARALVERVREARELSEEAAALYLQILALRAPTKAAVQQWNGWTARRYEKATDELVERGLVMEAKRSRAGRAHFLPGGWEDLKSPDLPVETWKLPLYGAERTEAGLHRPLGVLLPLRPLHELFEAAWARIEAGDPPRYEEVK